MAITKADMTNYFVKQADGKWTDIGGAGGMVLAAG
jgi:hypothetical protein